MLRLATYNIHACVGRDGTFDPGRTAAVIDELEPQVLALQEVEHHNVDGLDLLDELARRTGLQALAGPTLLRGGNHYGNALLTSLPIAAARRIDLSVGDREPRGAVEARLDWGGRRVQVIGTHLGLRPVERRWQVRRLLTCLETAAADYAVLMGDLNEWLLWGRPLRWLRGHFAPVRGVRTFPAACPLFALDRIWARPAGILRGLRAHQTPLARRASDHLPLVGEMVEAAAG